MDKLPTLSNEAQLEVMNMVKDGLSIEEAIAKAVELAAEEKKDKESGEKKDINKATLRAVTKMVEDGNISAKDAIRHAERLNNVRVRKKGDAQRILLMNMVKEGNLSIEEAIQHAKGMGVDVVSEPTTAKSGYAAQEGKIYNFAVYKFNRLKGAQRRILQLDFQTLVMCNVQRGQRNHQYKFSDIARVESADGVGFTIQFVGDKPDIDYEADTLEEKNRIFRLLSLIVNNNRAEAGTGGGAPGGGVGDGSGSPVLKEGRVEKKGHSMAMFNWASRWLQLRQGELAYFKEEDLNNALNILPLGGGQTSISKKGTDGFVIATGKKSYAFKIPAPAGYALAPPFSRPAGRCPMTPLRRRLTHSNALACARCLAEPGMLPRRPWRRSATSGRPPLKPPPAAAAAWAVAAPRVRRPCCSRRSRPSLASCDPW